MRALIITGKYAQDREVWYPFYRMEEEGWKVDIAIRDQQTVLGVIGEKLVPTMDIPVVLQGQHSVVILPGGARAMEYLRQDSALVHGLKLFHDWGGLIGAICHGTQLLISAGLVKGRRISGYYSISDDITNAGGTYVDAPFVTDERIVTSPHYKHLGPWMRELIRVAGAPRGVGEGDYGVE